MTETRSRSSAGIPNVGANDRLSEVEDRLARLEGTPSIRARSRDLMDHVMPPEASKHFRNAGREQLLGIRSIVDFWIGRIDAMESRAGGPDGGRETIKIE
jgi:hypothetical protein